MPLENDPQAVIRAALASLEPRCTLDWHAVLGSTNDRGRELAESPDPPLPCLVWAEMQTSGRGRNGHAWWSAAGSLTCSVVLNPAVFRLRTEQWSRVPLITALAVCDAIESLGDAIQPRLKWPNDVVARDRKLAGVLVEPAVRRGDTAASRLVIGWGLNVNNSFPAAPAELRSRGVSVRDLAGHVVDRESLLVDCLRRLWMRLRQLGEQDSHLSEDVQSRCSLTGSGVVVQQGSQLFSGRCLGIASSGELLLDQPTGPISLLAGHVVSITASS